MWGAYAPIEAETRPHVKGQIKKSASCDPRTSKTII